MYEEHFALRARPFQTTPDPGFLYWAEAHTGAFTMLRYGLTMRSAITVVTGEIGAGKTTLIRKLLEEAPDDLIIGLVSNMQADRGKLLQWVLMALGRPVSELPYVELFRQFQDLVIDAYAAGQRVVLIFDEAQNLDVASLEELRMLSNINTEKDELLQLVLVGQPQLRDLLSRPDLTQFNQRISADFHLEALNFEEIDAYINHRLETAGAQWRIFPRETCRLVHRATRGVPRLVNILCDLCLVYGFAADAKVVEPSLLREFLDMAQKRRIYTQFRPLDDGPVVRLTS